jgi:hypothetical protein
VAEVAARTNLTARLATRTKATPAAFQEALARRAAPVLSTAPTAYPLPAGHPRPEFTPAGSIDNVAPGAYYLQKVLPFGERIYARK